MDNRMNSSTKKSDRRTEETLVLGIELSSRQGSAALLKNGAVLAEKTWSGENVRHGVLFKTLEALLREAEVSYEELSLYAVGRGPGSFSGMRMGFAVAQALALPGKTEVRAVSSGAALALQTARACLQPVAVVGDARRGQLWFGMFDSSADEAGRVRIRQTGEWRLLPCGELVLPPGTVAVSPEAERLRAFIPGLGESRFPLASHVAELALMQETPEPNEPLYMHPPVFVPPKFA